MPRRREEENGRHKYQKLAIAEVPFSAELCSRITKYINSVKTSTFTLWVAVLMCLSVAGMLRAQDFHGKGHRCLVSGKVTSTEKETVDFATVYLKGTSFGGTTQHFGIQPIGQDILFLQ